MRGLVWCGLLVGCGRLDFAPVGDASTTSRDACDPSTRPVELQELHSGELVIGATETTGSVQTGLPIDRTILFTSIREAEPSPDYGNTICSLSADALTCNRNIAGTNYGSSTGEIHIRWTTATFSRGVTVQRGVANLTNTTPELATLTTIDPAESFVLLDGGFMNTGNSWGTDEYMRARIIDAQTVEVGALATSGFASWQVVTMTGARVQRGVASLAMTDQQTTVAITPVDLARSFALVSTTENSSIALGVAISMLTASIDTPSTLHLERGIAGVPLPAAWEVITLPFTVEHGRAAMTVGQTTVDQPSAAPASTSVVLASGQSVLGMAGGSSTYQTADGNLVDMVGEATITLVANAGTVTLARESSLGDASFPWSAIDFASCP